MKTAFASILVVSLTLSACSGKKGGPVGPDPTPQPPSGPTDLAVTVLSATEVNLAWVDKSSNEAGFRIEQAAAASSDFTAVGDVDANATTYRVTGLQPGTGFMFRVSAFNGDGVSAYSNIASAITAPAEIAAPTGIAGVFDPRTTKVSLSWTDNAGGRYKYTVEERTGQNWSQIGVCQPGVTTYVVPVSQDAAAITPLGFRVRAIYDDIAPAVFSAYSSIITVYVPKKPAAPTGLAIAKGSRLVSRGGFPPVFVTEHFLKLSWTNVAPNTSEIKVRRLIMRPGATLGVWETLPIIQGSTSTWTDNSMGSELPADGTKYSYQIQAYTTDGYTAWTESVTHQF